MVKLNRTIIWLMLGVSVFLASCRQTIKNEESSSSNIEQIDYSQFSEAKREFITRLSALNTLDENGVSGREITRTSIGSSSSVNKYIFDTQKDYGYVRNIFKSSGEEVELNEFYGKDFRVIPSEEGWTKIINYPEKIAYYNNDYHGNGKFFINPHAITYYEHADDDQFSFLEDGSPYFEPKYDLDLSFFINPAIHNFIAPKSIFIFNENGEKRVKDIYKDSKELLSEQDKANKSSFFEGDTLVIVENDIVFTFSRLEGESVPELPEAAVEIEAKDYHPDWGFLSE